jgi:uncharacterized protein YbaR (Trm112 family)
MPLEIPGTSIRPPEMNNFKKVACPTCHRTLTNLKKVTDPVSKKVKLICPFCGREVYGI